MARSERPASHEREDRTGSDDDDARSATNELQVAEGFFFDNYTSGSGFGVYGGEAVTSGQEQRLNLPSAGVTARNLGLGTTPAPAGGPLTAETNGAQTR